MRGATRSPTTPSLINRRFASPALSPSPPVARLLTAMCAYLSPSVQPAGAGPRRAPGLSRLSVLGVRGTLGRPRLGRLAQGRLVSAITSKIRRPPRIIETYSRAPPEGMAFFCLAPTHPLRARAHRLAHSGAFETVIMLGIFMNIAVMMLQRPSKDAHSIVDFRVRMRRGGRCSRREPTRVVRAGARPRARRLRAPLPLHRGGRATLHRAGLRGPPALLPAGRRLEQDRLLLRPHLLGDRRPGLRAAALRRLPRAARAQGDAECAFLQRECVRPRLRSLARTRAPRRAAASRPWEQSA